MAIAAGPFPMISSSAVDSILPIGRDEMQAVSSLGPIQLTQRFTTLKESLVSGNESALVSSWQRLLCRLPEEIDLVASAGSQIIPTINFGDITSQPCAQRFLSDLRERGVGVIRNVIPRDVVLEWNQEAEEYLRQCSQTTPISAEHHRQQQREVYWSATQVKARAHPNLLSAQRFVMSIWTSKQPSARVTTNFPITYADRLTTSSSKAAATKASLHAHVDGGSVERWEPDGYGRAGTYREIFQGRWEDYDPWESSTRLGATSDLYHRAGACSIFRMFQGCLALRAVPSGPGSSTVHVCPLPRLATAYFLLRPFFSPAPPQQPPPSPPASVSASNGASPRSDADHADREWVLTSPPDSVLHGALPGYAQAITPSLHPHLQLDRSLVAAPHLEPGDYLVWHPDLVHAIPESGSDGGGSDSDSPPCRNTTTPSKEAAAAEGEVGCGYMYLPACPLTQTNALYLARQRKAFLLGHPGPDFGGGRGESGHARRPGVQEVNDAGGDDGLRAMGLLPWDEEEAGSDSEREVLAMANGILFPDLYDFM